MGVKAEMREIGQRIRDLRKGKGMSMKVLGDKVGLSESMIWRYEKGDLKSMDVNVVEKIAQVLETPPEEILGWDDSNAKILYRRFRNDYDLAPFLKGNSKKIPIIDNVSDKPSFSLDKDEDYIELDKAVKGDFAVRAKGDSMIGARIFNNDLIICEKRDKVKNGEIAVILFNGEITLKRIYYFQSSGVIILKSENPDFSEIQINEDDFSNLKIIGKALTTIRDIK